MNVFENAKWIWFGDRKAPNVRIDFIVDFEALKGQKAELNLSCDFQYALYLNGEFINYGQYADFEEYKIYDSILLEDLADGTNIIKISAWHEERETACSAVQDAGLIYSLFVDGEQKAVSNKRTLCGINTKYLCDNVSSNQIGKNAVYDELDCAPQLFDRAQEVEKTMELLPRPIKKQLILPEKRVKVINTGSFISTVDDNERNQGKKAYFAYNKLDDKPKGSKCVRYLPDTELRLSSDSDGCWAIVDLGEETVGLVGFDITLEKDCRVLIGWGEHIEDGRVRSWLGGRNFCLDLKLKKGRRRFLYPYRRIGARFLQINVYADSAVLHHFSVRPTEYPLDHSQFFSCSDKLHNRICQVSARTLELCMHEHYEDCPWREQALYAMDSRNQMLCGYYAFGEFEFARASLALLSKVQRDDGLLELTAPSRGTKAIPSFSAMYFVELYEYMFYSKDLDFAYKTLCETEGILKSFEAQFCSNGLAKLYTDDSRVWNFYEWQEHTDGYKVNGREVFDAPFNAFISMAYRSAALIFEAAGDERSKFYFARVNEINEAINRLFYDPQRALYYTRYTKEDKLCHFNQLTQALAVFCGACDEDKLDGVLENMLENKELLPATLSYSIFVFDALMKRPEKYARTVFDIIARDWGYMLYNGATSFWETIAGADDFSYAGSLCHGWSSVPLYFYFRYALGYKIETDSFEKADCGLYEIDGNVDILRSKKK